MKRFILAITASIITLVSVVSYAEELKMVGSVSKIDPGTGKASVTIKDTTSGKLVTVTVTDQLTLDKLQDKRITIGDEVRVKYDTNDNVSKLLRKTAGC